jgi:hypothetical protein
MKNGKNAVRVLLMESEMALVSIDHPFTYQKYSVVIKYIDSVMTSGLRETYPHPLRLPDF